MNWSRSHFFLSVLVLCWVSLIASRAGASDTSAPTGTIQGVVLDEAGKPAVYANIVITGTARGAMADMDGIYTISSVPVGVYSLRAMRIGSEDAVALDVVVSRDQIARVDFVLRGLRPPEDIAIPNVVTSDISAVIYGALTDSAGYSLMNTEVLVNGVLLCRTNLHGVYVTDPMPIGTHVVSIHLVRCWRDSAAVVVLRPHEKRRLDMQLNWDRRWCEEVSKPCR